MCTASGGGPLKQPSLLSALLPCQALLHALDDAVTRCASYPTCAKCDDNHVVWVSSAAGGHRGPKPCPHLCSAATSAAVLSEPAGAAMVSRNCCAACWGLPRLLSWKPSKMGATMMLMFSSPLHRHTHSSNKQEQGSYTGHVSQTYRGDVLGTAMAWAGLGLCASLQVAAGLLQVEVSDT